MRGDVTRMCHSEFDTRCTEGSAGPGMCDIEATTSDIQGSVIGTEQRLPYHFDEGDGKSDLARGKALVRKSVQ